MRQSGPVRCGRSVLWAVWRHDGHACDWFFYFSCYIHHTPITRHARATQVRLDSLLTQAAPTAFRPGSLPGCARISTLALPTDRGWGVSFTGRAAPAGREAKAARYYMTRPRLP
eukprot:scaffold97678_cov75-Phaeocystis_antarctica.AAC.1